MVNRIVLAGSQLGLVDQSDSSLLDGFKQLGCSVTPFDYRATTFIPRWLSKIIPKSARKLSPRKLPGVEQADASASNRRFVLLVQRFRPQLVIALQAERLTPASLCRAQDAGAVLMNWILDDPEGRIDAEVVPLFDCWLVWDASVAQWLSKRGAKRVEHLPVACDPKRHYPVALSGTEKKRWKSSLCFVGGYQPNRESLLAAVSDMGLAVWGPGWEKAQSPALKPCIRGTEALGREAWLKAYAAADIVINIHSQGSAGLNLRVWETLAAGACLISDYRADIDRFLQGLVGVFRSQDELRRLCQGLLTDESRRKQMAEAGRKQVLARHTFRHRAEQILKWANEYTQRPS